MNELELNSSFIQDFSQAIAAILDLDVTIVDKNLIRIAATGIYKNSIGTQLKHGYFYKNVISQKHVGMIQNIKDDPNCATCAKRDTCIETACLSYPIIVDGEAIGLIAVVTFDDEQKRRLLKDQKKLEDFLCYMCLLLQSKLKETESNIRLKNQINKILVEQEYDFDDICSNNKKMQQILSVSQRIAATNSHILIMGEGGTGKRTLAKAIHQKSARHSYIPITIDCRYARFKTIDADDTLASNSQGTGNFLNTILQSNNSTLILNDISELSLELQAQVLKILTEKITAQKDKPLDIRCIATTTKNLEELVQQGLFLEDLYYYMSVIPIRILALRERIEDIPNLINHFIKLYEREFGKDQIIIHENALTAMVCYPWKGNIRELKSCLEYLVNINQSSEIAFWDLPEHIQGNGDRVRYGKTLNEMLEEYERDLYKECFPPNSSVEEKQMIAEQLGVSIATAYRKLNRFKLI